MNEKKLLKKFGYIVECESPFEIRHKKDGSFATGNAAYKVLEYIKDKVSTDKKILAFANFMGCHSGIYESTDGKQHHYQNPEELYKIYKKYFKK